MDFLEKLFGFSEVLHVEHKIRGEAVREETVRKEWETIQTQFCVLI